MTDWKAMQSVETVETRPDLKKPGTFLQTKERRAPGDVNVRQMSMGSWHASLSHDGLAKNNLGAKSSRTGAAGPAQRKK